MNSAIKNSIEEIAEQLDCGFRTFIHKTTEQLIFVPNINSYPEIDLNSWKEELKQIEDNFTNYYEIDKWSSSEAFEIMNEFADQVKDSKLQSRLYKALRKNKPFREFKFVMDNTVEFRQKWFEFKKKWQQDYVANQINRIKPKEE